MLRSLLTLLLVAGFGLAAARSLLPTVWPAQDHHASIEEKRAASREVAAGHMSAAERPSKGQWETDQITAYCSGVGDSTGTAQGGYAHVGSAAAGPDIPFGTRFKIPGLRTVTVDDRGSAVGNGHLDVWMPSCLQANKWGVRYLPVERLG